MAANPRETELEVDVVRQAVETRHVRWVLLISLTLGVVALGGAFVWYESVQTHGPAAAQADQRPTNG